MTGGEVEIVESAHEVDVEELEDVVYTHDELEVGLAAVHDITAVWEAGKYISRSLPAFCGRNGLFLSLRLPQRVLMAMYSRHLSFFNSGIRLKSFPFMSHDSIIEA